MKKKKENVINIKALNRADVYWKARFSSIGNVTFGLIKC